MPTTWVTDRLRTVRSWWHAHDAAVWDRWLVVVFTVLAFVPAVSRMGAEFGDLPRRAVYRVVQEGLTNAVKYATGQPTEVRTNYRDGQIEVAVTTAPALVTAGAQAGPSGGRGLKGLRERVTTLGGGLTAGEQSDGRFRVHAVIPIAGDA
jgi:signal transduction histidine kinase